MRPSLFRELSEKLARDPRLTRRGGPRVDLGLLLFGARDDLEALWRCADELVQAKTAPAPLVSAVEALRPIFGERPDPGEKTTASG